MGRQISSLPSRFRGKRKNKQQLSIALCPWEDKVSVQYLSFATEVESFSLGIMEGDMASHTMINGFRKEFSTIPVELKRKRKLQHDLGLPFPKHRCLDRSDNSGHGSPTAEDEEIEKSCKGIAKESTGKNGADELEQPAVSHKDNNSSIAGHDTSMIWEGDKIGMSSSKCFHTDKPSASWTSCNNNTLKNSVDFLDSRRSIEETNVCEKAARADGKLEVLDAIDQFESANKDIEDHHLGLSVFGDYIAEFENHGNSDGAADVVMLYYNDLTSNEFVLSSGRGTVVEDAWSSARKPTIDQEFEQYFSGLML